MRGNREIIRDGEIGIITLTMGLVSVIDAGDIENVSGSWFAKRSGNGLVYAVKYDSGKYQISKCRTTSTIILHRMLMRAPADMVVDHINGDTLDNRRSNLRVVTESQNNINRRLSRNNRSGVAGVCWLEKQERWQASVFIQGRCSIRYFRVFEDACAWRSDAEKKFYGEFARSA